MLSELRERYPHLSVMTSGVTQLESVHDIELMFEYFITQQGESSAIRNIEIALAQKIVPEVSTMVWQEQLDRHERARQDNR